MIIGFICCYCIVSIIIAHISPNILENVICSVVTTKHYDTVYSLEIGINNTKTKLICQILCALLWPIFLGCVIGIGIGEITYNTLTDSKNEYMLASWLF